ncbi:GNAT family N-acetyltransferase [Mesoterricola silvestris]|nr:GNAT family N-acetyltransferase [Mesoterricola silvestris]
MDAPAGSAWDALVASASPFLQRPYLRAVEGGLPPGEAMRYATFHEGGRLVGVACFQRTRFQGRPLGERFQGGPVLSFLARNLRLAARPLDFQVLVCGNPMAAGEHGFHFDPAIEPRRAVEALLAALDVARRELEGTGAIDGVLIKDLDAASHPYGESLDRHAFAGLRPEPAMALRLDPSWDSFEAYLGCLASKYRVKARRAYAKSQALRARDLGPEDLLRFQDRWMELFDAVHRRAENRLGRPTFATFLNLRRTLGPEFILRGYFQEDALVGFLTGFVWEGVLEAHLVGLDYALNQELSIYPRLLCDYLDLAIARGCRELHYGRTASEIKSTLGAEPIEQVCYLRHRDCLPNQAARLIAPRLRPETGPLRRPFTQAWYGLHAQPALG